MKRVLTFTLSVLAVLLLVSPGHTRESDSKAHGKFRGAKHRCDRLPNKADRAFCASHALHVGPSADGIVLPLLDKRFDLTFLDEEGDPEELRPTLIGPKELTRANWVVLLQEAYEAGHTIGLTNATPVDVDRFYHAVGLQDGCGQQMEEVLPLIALQKANTRRQTQRVYVCDAAATERRERHKARHAKSRSGRQTLAARTFQRGSAPCESGYDGL